MPTKEEKKGFDASSITGIPKEKKRPDYVVPGSKTKKTPPKTKKTTPPPSRDYFENKVMPKAEKAKADADAKAKAPAKPAVEVKTPPAPKDVVKPKPKGGTYASAKKKDPKLDSYIKSRNNAKKGSSDYNAAQNKINAAYGKGTTKRKVTVADGSKTSTGVMRDQGKETKAEKVTSTGIPKNVKAPKPKTAMEKAKEAIASGDKKAAKESGLKGGLKRQAKRSAGKKDREMARDDKKANKAEGRADKEAEKTAKKESIKAAGSRKAARLMDKSDAAKKAESSERESYNALETTRGKGKKIIAKAYKQVGKKEAKTDKVGSRLEKEQKKVVEKSKKDDRKKSEKDTKIANKKIDSDIKTKDKKRKKSQKNQLASTGSTDTKISGTMRGSIAKKMESYDQMDTKSAKATAGETAAKMYDGPIKYFKQAINYNVKEASNPSLSSSARKHYAENAQHDMKSIGEMNKPMAYMKGSVKKRSSFMERMTKNSK